MNPLIRFLQRLLLRQLPSLLLLVPAASIAQSSGDVHFWARDVMTRFGLDSAQLTLDTIPADGQPEFNRLSDPFGFLNLSGIPAGSYQLTISRSGYAPQSTNITVASSGTVQGVLDLAPVAPGLFDITVEVSDVMTGISLEGVGVKIERFNSASDTNPAESRSGFSDNTGFVSFNGVGSGFYRFLVNDPGIGTHQPGWMAFSSVGTQDDKTFLGSSHTADIKLEPRTQPLRIHVRGFDPVTGNPAAAMNVALPGVIVDVTGLDPRSANDDVLPTQSSLTDQDGNVLFTGLPPIPLRVEVRRMGYTTSTQIIMPDAAGNLPANPVDVALLLMPTRIEVSLASVYTNRNMHSFVKVRLEGMPESSTAGIVRELDTFSGLPANVRSFRGLFPGRYTLSVRDRQAENLFTAESVRPAFIGEEIVEAIEGLTTPIEIQLDVVPAILKGRLLAAASRARVTADPRPSADAAVYQARQESGIELVEHVDHPALGEQSKVYRFDTDENGEFQISVPPGRYGIRIPGMSGHWGSHVLLSDSEATEPEYTQGWPFHEWPFGGQPPRNGGLVSGTPLTLLPSRNYRLDMFVREHHALLSGQVLELNSPTKERILAEVPGLPGITMPYSDLAEGGGMVILEATDGSEPRSTPLIASDLSNSGNTVYLFENVPAGTYTVRFEHPRFTFKERFESNATLTLTIPPWAAPGMPPPVNPFDDNYVQPLLAKTLPVVEATYIPNTTQLSVRGLVWNDTDEVYEESILFPEAYGPFKTGYAGDTIFSQSGLYPEAPFSMWLVWNGVGRRIDIATSGTQQTVEVHFGGPDADSPIELPLPGYDLTIDAVSADDTTSRVPDVQVLFNTSTGPQTINAAGQTIAGFTGAISGAIPSHPFWTRTGTLQEWINPIIPHVKLTYLMSRGVQIRGVVRSDSDDSPIPGARVLVLNRHGRPVDELGTEMPTSANGQFAFSDTPVPAAPHFVQITQPGFVPWRKRFAPADFIEDPEIPGSSFIHVDARLVPISGPEIGEVSMNRTGLFLPGITRAGNEALFSQDVANDALTMTWTSEIIPQVISYEMQDFDLENGSPGPVRQFNVEDPVAEVWMIDPRVYFGPPQFGVSTPLALPPSDTPHALLIQWLAELRMGVSSNSLDGGPLTRVFHQVIPNRSQTVESAFNVSGQIHVGKLPPGDFKPLFFAISRSGAVSIRNDFSTPETPPQLEGLNLPPWIAAATDMISGAANIAATSGIDPTTNQLERWMPRGRLTALPKFTSTISETNGHIGYSYLLDVKWKEGMDTPRSGFLALAPSVLGLEFNGRVGFGLAPSNSLLYLRMNADVKGRTNRGSALPKGLPEGSLSEITLNIAASTVASAVLDPEDPRGFELMQSVGGGVETRVDANLKSLTSKLPHVGPVLAALDRARALQIYGTVVGGIGMVSTARVSTVYPPPRPATSVPGQLDQVYRRDFLGGNEAFSNPILVGDRSLDLCVRFGGGLTLRAGEGGRAGASGLFLIQGNQCNAGFPALSITPNIHGDWPFLSRVKGSLDFELEAFLDVWVSRFRKKWTWPLITIDHQFGTEPTFTLQPLQIENSVLHPSDAAPATFSGADTILVSDFLATGTFEYARSDQNGGTHGSLIFTDVDPESGLSVLRQSIRDGSGTFSEPIEIVQAPGILASTLAWIPDIGWIAVWSEISAADIGNPFPSSTVKYSIRGPIDSSWATPISITTLPDAGFDLQLVIHDASATLVILHTDRGPASTTASLDTTTFDGVSWSPLEPLLTDINVESLKIVSVPTNDSSPGLAIGVLDDSHSLRVWYGSPEGLSDSSTVATDANSAFAMAIHDAGPLTVAWYDPAEGIILSQLGQDGEWSQIAVIPNVHPAQIALAAAPSEAGVDWWVAWTAGGAALNLHHALVDATGTVIYGPSAITRTASGVYGDIHIEPQTDGTAWVLVRHDDAIASLQQIQATFDETDAPVLASPRVLIGGEIEFFIIGDPNIRLLIQRSFDLDIWTDIATDIAPSEEVPFSDTPPENTDAVYYRAIKL